MAFWTSWRRKAPAQAVAHTPAQLFHLPQNPMPDGMTAWNLVTADGKRIRYARLRTSATPFRGTVIMLHGRNECIEK